MLMAIGTKRANFHFVLAFIQFSVRGRSKLDTNNELLVTHALLVRNAKAGYNFMVRLQ